MRWLALAVLSACQFTPGTFGADPDANGSGQPDTGAPDGMTIPTGPPFVRRIDITDVQVTGGPHTDFPLLVSVTADWLKSTGNGGTVANAQGFDIHFSSDLAGTTLLAHEIEAYDPGAGSLVAWVKVSSLAPDTTLYIHYGDASITTNTSTPTAVWTNGFAAVVHLAGLGDSTTGATTPGTMVSEVPGQIGPGRLFAASTSRADLGSTTATADVFSGGGTIEAWIHPASDGGGGFGRIIDKGVWSLLMDSTDEPASFAFLYEGGSTSVGVWSAPASSIVRDTWSHVAVVYNKDSSNNDPTIYLDGAVVTAIQKDTATGVMESDATETLWGGNRTDNTRAFDGILDELRVSTGTRSAGWFATEYANQSTPSAFYTISAPL